MANINFKKEEWRDRNNTKSLIPDGRLVLVKLFDGTITTAKYKVKAGVPAFFRKGLPISVSWWHEINPEDYTIEMCPECGEETIIFSDGITPCRNCGAPVIPCSECSGKGNCNDCDFLKIRKEYGGMATNRKVLKKEAAIVYPML